MPLSSIEQSPCSATARLNAFGSAPRAANARMTSTRPTRRGEHQRGVLAGRLAGVDVRATVEQRRHRLSTSPAAAARISGVVPSALARFGLAPAFEQQTRPARRRRCRRQESAASSPRALRAFTRRPPRPAARRSHDRRRYAPPVQRGHAIAACDALTSACWRSRRPHRVAGFRSWRRPPGSDPLPTRSQPSSTMTKPGQQQRAARDNRRSDRVVSLFAPVQCRVISPARRCCRRSGRSVFTPSRCRSSAARSPSASVRRSSDAGCP